MWDLGFMVISLMGVNVNNSNKYYAKSKAMLNLFSDIRPIIDYVAEFKLN